MGSVVINGSHQQETGVSSPQSQEDAWCFAASTGHGFLPGSQGLAGKVTLDVPGYDPLHAAYIAAQNFTSLFMEEVTQFPEFDSYWKIYGPAVKEYMPQGPPISPLTKSFFTTWAVFDLRFGPDRETIGTCLLDVADLLGMDSFMAETIRQAQDSRMGIYEHCGIEDGRCRLRELVTDKEFRCHNSSGYRGKAGELWYVRLGSPLLNLVDYYVAFTTPYVLVGATKADWMAYLNKNLMGSADMAKTLHDFMKFGKAARSRKADRSWSEFVFQAYQHHQFDAIFLAGLPDVKGSRPHAE
jgi:hypothetical protein